MYHDFLLLEYVSNGTIRRFEWILRQFKEEIRRLNSAKSSLVTQKWRSDAEIAYSGIFETHYSELPRRLTKQSQA